MAAEDMDVEVGHLLAAMGADVVQIGSSNVEGIAGANTTDHPYYVMWNRNKRSLALDLSQSEARAICRRLCDAADVVIDNFSVGVLDRWGVGYDDVAQTNPRVIYVQMSGMGEGGPWSKFVTYAPTVHAPPGIPYLTVGSPALGVALFLAMVVTMAVAGLLGAIVPLFLKAVHLDPALGAGVIVTTFTDVFAFFSFLGIATLLLDRMA